MQLRSFVSLLTTLLCAAVACSESGSADRAVAQSGATSTASTATPAAPCRLKLGWDPFEPYQYRNAEGAVEGLDIELTRAILVRAHCEVQYEEGRWVTLVQRLQRGAVDVLAGATRTPAREAYALFSDPYRNETIALYVRKDDATVQRSTSLQTLLDAGFRLGVRQQYAYGEAVEALQEDPRYADQFIGVTLGDQNYQRLLDMEIDGFLEDPVSARLMIRKKGLQEEIEPHPLPIYSGDVALMFSRGSVDAAIVERINTALAEVRAGADYQSIVGKYIE